MTSPNPAPMDDHESFLAEQMTDPAFRAAYEDANAAYRLTVALVNAREVAGMTSDQVGDCIADGMGGRRKRYRRMVADYESGELQHNAQLWFLSAYARAVGARLKTAVEINDDGS